MRARVCVCVTNEREHCNLSQEASVCLRHHCQLENLQRSECMLALLAASFVWGGSERQRAQLHRLCRRKRQRLRQGRWWEANSFAPWCAYLTAVHLAWLAVALMLLLWEKRCRCFHDQNQSLVMVVVVVWRTIPHYRRCCWWTREGWNIDQKDSNKFQKLQVASWPNWR